MGKLQKPQKKELTRENHRRVRDFGNLVADVVFDEIEAAFGMDVDWLPVAKAAEKAVTRALTAGLATVTPAADQGAGPPGA